MSTTTTFDVRQLPELYRIDPARVALAKSRQTAVWAGRKPDAYPIFFSAGLTADQAVIPRANYREAFFDADLMLCTQFRGACTAANAKSDAVPSIRANLGTGILLSCLGLEQEVFEDKMPWLQERLTKEQVRRLEPDDIKVQGSFARGLEQMRHFRAIMGEAVAIYCMDTQGPLDLAHLLLGDDLFLDMYDDPAFVHHALELCVELTLRTTRWMKEVSGEPAETIYHGNQIYAENMGVRVCEDTTVLISPESIEEFAMPYTRRVAQAFGGAWVHYCGRNDHLTDAILSIPEVRGINFGHIPGHVHDQPFEQVMQRCLAAGKLYKGNWPRFEGESGRAYLDRMWRWAQKGCLIPVGNPAVKGADGFGSVAAAQDYWYALQA